MIDRVEVRRLYLELESVKRVGKTLCMSPAPLYDMVTDLMPIVRARVSRRQAVTVNEERVTRAERRKTKELALETNDTQWRCSECGAKATGLTCVNGHIPPWAVPYAAN